MTVGFCKVDEYPAGPFQVYVVTVPLGLAVKDSVPPRHMGCPVGAAPAVVFTVTVVVYTVLGLHPDAKPLPTVNEYTPVTVGVITGF